MLDFRIIHDLFVRGVANIEHFTTKRKDAIEITTHDGEPRDGECLGTVPLGENEGTFGGLTGTRQIGIIQFGNAR